jgi:hypothetical protein
MIFKPELYPKLEATVKELKGMKRQGYPLYDSDIYLEDIVNFVEKKPMKWRSKNEGVCDSPTLYFAIIPNGDLAVCCDHRLKKRISTFDSDFVKMYKDGLVHQSVLPLARACDGCLYGSYPEITTTARFYSAMLDHAMILLAGTAKRKNWPLSVEELEKIADNILEKHPSVEQAGASI